MYYIKNDKGVVIGRYELSPLPGCKAVAVSHGLVIDPEYRRQGWGHKAMAERIEIAKSLGYQVLIATTEATNTPQQKILMKAGWKIARGFLNPRTGHDLTLWTKHLTDPYLDISDIGV